MEELKLKQATLSDLVELLSIGKQTFIETFEKHNTKENLENYVVESFAFEKYESELLNPNSLFFLAKLCNETAGYLKINFNNAQTELKDKNAMEIERIYVKSKFQGKKIGKILFEKAMEIAKNETVDFVWLGVWEFNEKALQFYKKAGFVVFDSHKFKMGTEVQTDLMMKIEMK